MQHPRTRQESRAQRHAAIRIIAHELRGLAKRNSHHLDLLTDASEVCATSEQLACMHRRARFDRDLRELGFPMEAAL